MAPASSSRNENQQNRGQEGERKEKPSFADTPHYLIKLSSTLFKKASAAEVFFNKLDWRKKRQKEKADKAKEAKLNEVESGFIKVNSSKKKPGPNKDKDNIVHNLMSEQSAVIIPKRRKSVEVLMTEKSNDKNDENLDWKLSLENNSTALESKPKVPSKFLRAPEQSNDNEPEKIFKTKTKTNDKKEGEKEMDLSFKSE